MDRRTRTALLLVLLTGLAVRVSLALRFVGSPFAGVQGGDMQFYHEWAVRISQGQWTNHHAFYGLPGYAFLLAGFYKLFGVAGGLWVMLRCQDLLATASAALIFDLTRRVVPPGRYMLPAAFLASLAYDLFLPAQALSLILMPTSWAVLAYWLCVRFAIGQGKSRAWFPIGLLVGVAATLVATILFALPLLLLSAWRRSARPALAAAALAGGLAAGTAPVWLHNCFVAREPVFLSAHGGINFYIGNYADANGYPKIPPELPSGQQELLDDSIHRAEAAVGHSLTRPEVSRYWSGKAWAEIRARPGHWVRLLGLKVKAFWNAFEYDDLTIIALLREDGVLLPGPGFGAVAALGLAGLCLALWQGRPARWVAAAVLLHLAALLSVFITERYRLAAVPGLIVLGANLLVWTAEGLSRRWFAAATLLALSSAAVFLPAAGQELTSMQPYNLAISELDHPELLEQARAHLQTAERYAPNNPNLLFAFARYWSAKGDREQAKAFYRRTLEIEPRFAEAYVNLALLRMEEAQWESAAHLLAAATALRPEDAGPHYLLARARKETGDFAGALTEIDEALRLAPGQAQFIALRSAIVSHETKPPL